MELVLSKHFGSMKLTKGVVFNEVIKERLTSV